MIDLQAELAPSDAAFPVIRPACDFDKTDRAWREMKAENRDDEAHEAAVVASLERDAWADIEAREDYEINGRAS